MHINKSTLLTSLEQTNQNLIKVPKVLRPTNEKTLGTSVWFNARKTVLTNIIECEI